MRFRAPLNDLLATPSSLAILRAWLEVPARTFTGRELAQKARVHPNRTHEVLRRFEDVGLAEHRTIGRAHLWQLRSQHWLFPPLQKLFQDEARAYDAVAEKIRKSLEQMADIRAAVLFGSLVSGSERPSSDIDLLVLVDSEATKRKLAGQLEALQKDIGTTFGNPLSPLMYSAKEYNRKRGTGLVKSIQRQGRVLLGRLP